MLGRAATTRPTLISSASMPADGRTISACWSGIGSPTSMAKPILMGPWHGWCLHCEWFTLDPSRDVLHNLLLPWFGCKYSAGEEGPLLGTLAGRSRFGSCILN